MSSFKFFSSVLFAVLFSLITCYANAQVDDNTTTVETVEIITPVPAPKETINIPEGYVGCFTVAAGWYQNVWYPAHKVCQYDPAKVKTAEGSAWVDSHWACTQQAAGQCTNWKWVPGHWVKTFSVY